MRKFFHLSKCQLLLFLAVLGLTYLNFPTPLRRLASVSDAAAEFSLAPPSKTSPALSGSTPLEELAQKQTAAIAAISTEAFSSEFVNQLWANIERSWETSNLPLRIGHPKVDPSELLKHRLKLLVSDLNSKLGVRILTPELTKKFSTDGLTCRYEGHCTTLDGLYLPLSHLIFLNPLLNITELSRVFLHELLHAYQFTYRFPIDTTLLYQLTQDYELEENKIPAFLDFYYEGQANWKGIQFSFPDAWYPEILNGDKNLQVGLSRLLVSGAATYAIVMSGATVGTAYLAYGLSWLGQIAYGNLSSNSVLPRIAKSESLLTINNTPKSRLEAALKIPELIPIHERLTRISGFASYDFEFHLAFSQAIQKYYFGNEAFLFHNDRDDLAIYNRLNDRYYSSIGISTEVDLEPDCMDLLAQVRKSVSSPLVAWLTLPLSEIERCPAYRGKVQSEALTAHRDALLEPSTDRNPFENGFPGTEGSRPGLTLLPQLRILPLN